VGLELAILTFEHHHGAEQAFAHLGQPYEDAPWRHELAFVERHRRGRIVVRGTFAGHYLDIQDAGDVIGRDTVIGALTGAVIGAAFGPPGFAAGLVAGASVGGFVQSSEVPELEGELFEQIRVHVPEGSSAIALLAAPEHVDAMVPAFADLGGHAYRRLLTDEEASVLQTAAARSPLASVSPAVVVR
jgi:uncharacterized membrane protein